MSWMSLELEQASPNPIDSARGGFQTLEQLEKEHIQKALLHCNGNKFQAAKMLGIDRVSLWRKLKSFGE